MNKLMEKIPMPFVKVMLTLLCLIWADRSQAEHLEKARKHNRSFENSLAGVFINSRNRGASRLNADGKYIEPIASVLKTLGAPQKITSKNNCQSEYLWVKKGVRIEVFTGCIFEVVAGKDVLRGHGAYSVEVWGNRAAAAVPGTGRGLALGDELSKAKRLYAAPNVSGQYADGAGTQDTHGLNYTYYESYQWEVNGFDLNIDAGANGRVNHIQLMVDPE